MDSVIVLQNSKQSSRRKIRILILIKAQIKEQKSRETASIIYTELGIKCPLVYLQV